MKLPIWANLIIASVMLTFATRWIIFAIRQLLLLLDLVWTTVNPIFWPEQIVEAFQYFSLEPIVGAPTCLLLRSMNLTFLCNEPPNKDIDSITIPTGAPPAFNLNTVTSFDDFFIQFKTLSGQVVENVQKEKSKFDDYIQQQRTKQKKPGDKIEQRDSL